MPELELEIDLPIRAADSPRTRRVARAFELGPLRGPGRLPVLDPTTVRLSAGELAYLVGASGSGKSQLLGALARRWPGPVVAGSLGGPGETGRRAVLDLLDLPIEPTLRLLCLAGLAEARLWLSPPRALSAGQTDRLALARLYAQVEHVASADAGRHGQLLLLIDEFGSRLDRLTAGVLAAGFRRWFDRTANLAAVVATAHDDLADPLRPDWLWVKTEGGLRVVGQGTRDGGRVAASI